ncbi:DUF2844 domain-containing protein [Janthinobacterium sp. SUN120]|uniref:DUF2844 domain-containing protein n=1 Tax=Janthinobacterium sp. SUN120 TaxID=3004099 RepID=UPI0025B0D2C3|nr:DUF2844 domain-containing protein [Janthinobacterium sp. SUN120]MDN2716748.1 DUF2844 domain-containing protein [Janthinobacterium sp. SUN120]
MFNYPRSGPARRTNQLAMAAAALPALPAMRPAILVCLLGIFSPASQAGLGDIISPAQGSVADARAMHARSFSTVLDASASTSLPYSSHRIVLPDGGVATEFADAGGFVFAVSWAAPTMPDLASLLGAYKPSLDRAQVAQRSSRIRSPRLLNATAGDWTIVSSGHLRAYSGYSYLSSRLPAGFDLATLR